MIQLCDIDLNTSVCSKSNQRQQSENIGCRFITYKKVFDFYVQRFRNLLEQVPLRHPIPHLILGDTVGAGGTEADGFAQFLLGHLAVLAAMRLIFSPVVTGLSSLSFSSSFPR